MLRTPSPRILLGPLVLATLGSLSCSVVSLAPQATAPEGPPPVAKASAPVDPQVAAVAAHIADYRTGLTPQEEADLAEVIVFEARRHDFDPGLILAVMHVESRFDNFAVSPVQAMGLMQILPSTGKWLAGRLDVAWHGPQTLFDPIANVRIGVAYLRQLTDRYGSLSTALSAYNWGPTRIDRRIRQGSPLPQLYARLVLEAYGDTATRS